MSIFRNMNQEFTFPEIHFTKMPSFGKFLDVFDVVG